MKIDQDIDRYLERKRYREGEPEQELEGKRGDRERICIDIWIDI